MNDTAPQSIKHSGRSITCPYSNQRGFYLLHGRVRTVTLDDTYSHQHHYSQVKQILEAASVSATYKAKTDAWASVGPVGDVRCDKHARRTDWLLAHDSPGLKKVKPGYRLDLRARRTLTLRVKNPFRFERWHPRFGAEYLDVPGIMLDDDPDADDWTTQDLLDFYSQRWSRPELGLVKLADPDKDNNDQQDYSFEGMRYRDDKAENESKDETVPEAKANDKTEMLRRAIEALATDQVDEDEVRRIARDELGEHENKILNEVKKTVNDKIKKASLPTTVEIKDAATREVRQIPGLQHQVLPKVLMALNAGEHVWMVGPAGTGKSTIGHQVADSLNLHFYALSLSPNTPLSEIVGYRDANGNYVRTVFRDAYEHGGVILFDEVDNGHPSTLAKINMSLSNGSMAFPDGMVQRHEDFRCIAAANTFGTGPDRAYVGRLQIDAATLDRFATVFVPVDEALEHQQVVQVLGEDDKRVDKVLETVRSLRQAAEDANLPVVFSPRASVGMARLLKAGMSWNEAYALRIRKGISESDWRKLKK